MHSSAQKLYVRGFWLIIFHLLCCLPLVASGSPQQIFYVGVDKHVYHYFATPGTSWSREDLTNATGAPAAESGLTSFEDALSTTQHVIYVTSNQHICHIYALPGHPWAYEDLMNATGAPASTSAVSGFQDFWNDALQIFYVGQDGHVRHLFRNPNSSWAQEDLSAMTGIVPASPRGLTSFEDVARDSQQVFFVGTNQHVYEIFGTPGNPWAALDVTVNTGAPLTASTLNSYVNLRNDSQNLVYVGTNQHVYHLFALVGTSWSTEDLNAATGAAPALPDTLTSFVDHIYHAEQIFFIGTNRHVYHFFATPGGPWGVEDMTVQTGAPLAASSLASFDDVWHSTQQILFIGLDGHVYHFFAVPGNPWALEDVTASASATLASVSPNSLNSWQVDGSQVWIGGQVVRYNSGLPGITLTLSGAGTNSSQTTDANGRFSFRVPMGGTYTLSPSAGNQQFSPASRVIDHIQLNQVVNFSALGGGTLSTTFPLKEYIHLGAQTVAVQL